MQGGKVCLNFPNIQVHSENSGLVSLVNLTLTVVHCAPVISQLL